VDTPLILNKKLHVTKLTFEDIKKIFTHFNSPNRIYRPVAYFSFALNYFFGRDNVTGYHFFNISIHLTSKIKEFDNVIKRCALAQKINPNIRSTYDHMASVLMEKGDLEGRL